MRYQQQPKIVSSPPAHVFQVPGIESLSGMIISSQDKTPDAELSVTGKCKFILEKICFLNCSRV